VWKSRPVTGKESIVLDDAQKKHFGNMVVASSGLAVFCLFGYRSTFALLLQPLANDMGWGVSQTSLGYSLMMTIYAVTAYFSGVVIDRWGTRPAYLIGSVFAALGFSLTSLADSYMQYLLGYSLFAGIGTGMLWVSSTVSVRKWHVGPMYARMWGLAFMGAPAAQVLLSLALASILVSLDWRYAMRIMAVAIFALLLLAALVARRNPEDYGMEPQGFSPHAAAKNEGDAWTIGTAFRTYPVWAASIAFLTSVLAEFLVWSQLVSYWVRDGGMDAATAAHLYTIIGITGLFAMPLTGIAADTVVRRFGLEARGRKYMVVFAPLVGAAVCLILRGAGISPAFSAVACALFAVYWAIEPGGIAGYVGSIYGGKNLGKIWGLGTLIAMGIGPATGSFLGGYFFDLFGNYAYSFIFAAGSFLASALVALTMPVNLALPKSGQ
jgi:MFS family permease